MTQAWSQPMASPVLVVTAHMDDETVFAWRTIRLLTERGADVAVLAVTRPAGDLARLPGFLASCEELGVQPFVGEVCDQGMWRRLDDAEVLRTLTSTLARFAPARVLCHGPLGEYGHPHHRQVWRACTALVDRPGFLAGPFEADLADLRLTDADHEAKHAHFRRHYPQEGDVWRLCTRRERWRASPLTAGDVAPLRAEEPLRWSAELDPVFTLPSGRERDVYLELYRSGIEELAELLSGGHDADR